MKEIILKLNNGEEIIIVQIAGLIARRIVCEVEQGQDLKQGERIGMIRFGSKYLVFFDETNLNFLFSSIILKLIGFPLPQRFDRVLPKLFYF